jgi:hypothetical protein
MMIRNQELVSEREGLVRLFAGLYLAGREVW